MNRILVAGASGNLGRHLVAELKKRGKWVRALTRSPSAYQGEADETVGADLLDGASLQPACDGIDAVISAAGASVDLRFSFRSLDFHDVDYIGNRSLLHAARQSGVNKFVYVSVFPALGIHDTNYVQAHLAVEEELQQSGLAHAIVQPTGYFSAFSAVLNIARSGFAPLIGDGTIRTNPIHEADLAPICVDALNSQQTVFPVGGPDVLTRREIFLLAFQALKKKPRFIPIPGWWIDANKMCVSPFDKHLGSLLAFYKAVSLHDVVAPQTGTRRLCDYFPALARQD